MNSKPNPCLTPFRISHLSEKMFSIFTNASEASYRFLTREIKWIGTPNSIKVETFYSVENKAAKLSTLFLTCDKYLSYSLLALNFIFFSLKSFFKFTSLESASSIFCGSFQSSKLFFPTRRLDFLSLLTYSSTLAVLCV